MHRVEAVSAVAFAALAAFEAAEAASGGAGALHALLSGAAALASGALATASLHREERLAQAVVSERKETEARLAASERLASVGRLAAGVAHEINNPLSWVMSNLDQALDRQRREGGDRLVAELLGEAKQGAERVRDIVRDLRGFARAGEEGDGGSDAVAVVRDSLAMVRNELRHRARVETAFAAVPRVTIAPRQLGQVLVNLLVNAAHSIREGEAAANRIRVDVRRDGDAVLIEVRDTGCGMAPEVLARVFEPFFTTTGREGMGLGLALSQTMVQEAGGRIEAESRPGEGSTFRVRLRPASEAEATPADGVAVPVPGAAATPVPVPGRARLLVVDDEPLVGRAVVRALREHDAEWVSEAREALARIRAGVRYDALICDLMMPEMTGMELAQRLADDHHELSRRIVFLTGGAFTDRAREFVALTRAPVIEKPFELQRLRAGVAAVLRGA
ncbi:MAG TPA: ATP-binding protein [Anaeromyxobacteraceae bacterium]|nr:ATP-binding protein [Anaeromyxobacteraceae bacterium]